MAQSELFIEPPGYKLVLVQHGVPKTDRGVETARDEREQ